MLTMKKGRRSTTVILGLFFSTLLIIPPIYMASAALFDQIDQDALNRRIAMLQSTAVDSPIALQARYRNARLRTLPILPPVPEYTQTISGGIVVFELKDFEDWEKVLEPAELNGVTVYPVTLAEDPEARNTVVLNSLGVSIATLAPEKDYNPFAWLAAWRPSLYAENADPDALAWAEAVYDPSRVSVTFYLLPADAVEDMATAQLAAMGQKEPGAMRMMMGEGLPEPVTNIVIFGIERVTNGMAMGIGWPDDFTNKLEVFARTNLASTGWYVVSTNLSTAGTNSMWWVDASISTNVRTRFYRIGNADLDSDGDGLTDAREQMMYGTDAENSDSDSDGFSDYQEVIESRTDPNNNDTNKPIVMILFPPCNGSWVWLP